MIKYLTDITKIIGGKGKQTSHHSLTKWLKQNKKGIRKFADLSFLFENIVKNGEFLHWKISYKRNYKMSPQDHDLHCELWHRIHSADKLENEYN